MFRLIIEPDTDHVMTAGKFIHIEARTLDNGFSTAPDRIVVNERQVDHIQLVLDSA
jgi:hypothetical protein